MAAYDPWNESEIVRSTLFGNDGTGVYRAVNVDATGALKIQGGGGGGSGALLTTDPTNSTLGQVVRNIPWGTYECLLVDDTVVLQAEIPENTAPPGMTTVLVTGGLDRGRFARNQAVDAGGRTAITIMGTVAPRWSKTARKASIAANTYILGLKHKGNINGASTTNLAYIDMVSALCGLGTHIDVILNPTLTGASFADVELAASFVQVDTAATYTAASGRVIFGFDCAGSSGTNDTGSSLSNLGNLSIFLNPNDILAFVATPDASSGPCRVTPNWHEAP